MLTYSEAATRTSTGSPRTLPLNYVPSLLWHALQDRGDPALCFLMDVEGAKRGHPQLLEARSEIALPADYAGAGGVRRR